jgi:hypothetical protein
MIRKSLIIIISYLFLLILLPACKTIDSTEITEKITTDGYPVNHPYVEENNGYPEPELTMQILNPEDIGTFPTAPDPNPGLGSLSAV